MKLSKREIRLQTALLAHRTPPIWNAYQVDLA